jgi:hypothetical protein
LEFQLNFSTGYPQCELRYDVIFPTIFGRPKCSNCPFPITHLGKGRGGFDFVSPLW